MGVAWAWWQWPGRKGRGGAGAEEVLVGEEGAGEGGLGKGAVPPRLPLPQSQPAAKPQQWRKGARTKTRHGRSSSALPSCARWVGRVTGPFSPLALGLLFIALVPSSGTATRWHLARDLNAGVWGLWRRRLPPPGSVSLYLLPQVLLCLLPLPLPPQVTPTGTPLVDLWCPQSLTCLVPSPPSSR